MQARIAALPFTTPRITGISQASALHWASGMTGYFHDLSQSLPEKAKLLVLIGVRYNKSDEHIWNPIRHTTAEVAVVNPDFTTDAEWVRSRVGETTHLANSFSDVDKICAKVISALNE